MTLYEWQQIEIDKYGIVPKRAIFAAPRTGKTRVAATLVGMWDQNISIVTAPLSVCPAWVEELESLGNTVYRAYRGPVASVKAFLGSKPTGIVIVVNDDRLAPLEKELLKCAPLTIIGDESHRFRGVSTKKARTFRKICWQAKYVRIMSGTPAPNHYGNLWGQLSCLNKDAWGSYETFARRYLVRDSMFRSKVIGTVNDAELMMKVRACSTVVRREDVFGPDTWQTIERLVEMPKAARKIYDDLKRQWLHEKSEASTLSTNHVLTRLLRMQQIASGFVKWDNGALETVHEAKIEAVLADLEEIIESGEKAVIFHKFSWESHTYVDAIRSRFGIGAHTLNGSTSPNGRQVTIDAINDGRGPHVAVVQTQAGGTGISLRGATHALFVSQLFNFDDEQQARDRIYSPGESRCVTYYRCRATVDEYIASKLALKQNVQDSVMGDFINGRI